MSNTILQPTFDEKEDKDERSALQADFMDAAWHGSAEKIQRCIERGADVDGVDVDDLDQYTALIAATRNGHLAAVDALIRAGASLEKESLFGLTALRAAIFLGSEVLVARLCDAGAKVDGQVLESAARCGHPRVVRELLGRGARAEASLAEIVLKLWCNPERQIFRRPMRPRLSPRLSSLARSFKACLDLLTPTADIQAIEEAQGSWSSRDGRRQSHHEPIDVRRIALANRVAKAQTQESIAACLAAPSPLPPDLANQAQGLFAYAASRGRVKDARGLLPYSDPKLPDCFGATPLIRAAEGAHAATVKLLLPYSDANARDMFGATALISAARLDSRCNPGALDCVKALLPLSDADAMSRPTPDAYGNMVDQPMTALMIACSPARGLGSRLDEDEQALAMVRVLAESSDIHLPNPDGKSALAFARESGREWLAQELSRIAAAKEKAQIESAIGAKQGLDAQSNQANPATSTRKRL